MSTGFFKSNEKVIMTLLLLILAPTFAATGLVESFFGSGNPDYYVVFGENIDAETFLKNRRSISEGLWTSSFRRFGPYSNRSRYGSARADDVLGQMVLNHDRLARGLEPSEERKREEVRNAALDLIAWYRFMEQVGWTPPVTYQEAFPEWSAIRNDPNLSFKTVDYDAAFNDVRFGLAKRSERDTDRPVTKKDFEEAVVRNLRIQQLYEAVVGSIAVSEEEIYNDFLATYEKRILEVVQIPADSFIEEARESVTVEDFEQYFNDNSEEFLLENRLSVEVARVNRNNLISSVNYEPTAEEIEAKYAEDRDILYRIRRPEGYVPPEDASPEDEYRPLPEVFERVVRSIQQAKAQEQEAELLQSALDALINFRSQGETVELKQVFPEGLEYVEFSEVEPFTQRELGTLDATLRNPAAYSEFFVRERNTPGSVMPGDLYEAIATNSQGNFIIRVREMMPKRPMTYDEALEDVIKATEENKAKALASTAVEGWVSQIAEGSATLQSTAEENNYTVNSLEPLTRTQSFNVRINGNTVPAARDLLTSAFDIQEVGTVIGPVVSDLDKAVYMVRIQGMGDAVLELFETLKDTIEIRLINQKRTALWEEYRANLMAEADIQQFLNDEETASTEDSTEDEGEATSG